MNYANLALAMGMAMAMGLDIIQLKHCSNVDSLHVNCYPCLRKCTAYRNFSHITLPLSNSTWISVQYVQYLYFYIPAVTLSSYILL